MTDGDQEQVGGALAGMRVLELGTSTAGAYCAKLLSDLGAEVVKVEAPEGDPGRAAGPFAPDRRGPETSGRFLYLATGKHSVVLDVDRADDRRRLGDLVAGADVVLDDGPAGLEPTEGLADDTIRCSISPFGLDGPYSGYRAHHLNIAHAGGEGHLLPGGVGWSQFPDRPPVQIGSDMADFDTGANAAVAVLGAFLRQRRSGHGQRIDVTGLESQLALLRTRLVRWTCDGTVLHQRPSPYVAAGGMFECADGHVQILGPREESWRDLTGVAGGEVFADERFTTLEGRTTHVDELNGILAGWCAERTKPEIVGTLAPIGFAVGAYSVPQDLLDSPQLEARGFFQTVDHPVAGPVVLPGQPFSLSATPIRLAPAPLLGSSRGFEGERPARSAATGTPGPPLEGLRVLDFTWAIAGPYATMLLAILGAEVIRVESSKRPDVTRRGLSGRNYGGVDDAPDYNTLNLNKRSFQVDLTTAEGLDLVRQLVPHSHVVVDNFRPGVMQRFGLGASTLLEAYPSLIVAASSGNGSTGPEALYAGLASIFAAVGGVSEQTGYPDAPPTLIGESPDFRSGNLLAMAILAALAHRDRTGQGQFIDLSSTEVMTALAPYAFLSHTLGAPPAARSGNRHPAMSPHGVYACAGEHQWLSVAVGDNQEWTALCGVLGRGEWGTALADPEARRGAEAQVDAAISAWTGRRSARDAFTELQAAGIPATPSFTNADLANDPHLAQRSAFVEVPHPSLGVQHLPAAPWHTSDGHRPWQHAPLLGEANGYVLGELLGLTPEQVSALGNIFV